MGGIYTNRFLGPLTGMTDYIVPPGKRAIVKCVSAYNPSAAAQAVSVSIGIVPVLYMPIPAGAGAERSDLAIAFASGEQMRVNVTGTASGQVTGWLLDE